jgi:hypothetical protein
VRVGRLELHFACLDLVLVPSVRQERPSLVEVACQVSMSWLAGSRWRSNQMAYRSPAGLESTQGKNWSLRAGTPPAYAPRDVAQRGREPS